MGFSCSVLDSSLAELKSRKLIDEVRIIKEPYRFHLYNTTKTKIAQEVYKIDTKGKMIYDEVRTGNNNYVAEPNKWIFQEIQRVKDQFEVKIARLAKTKNNLSTDSSVKNYVIVNRRGSDTTGLSTKNFLNTLTDADGFVVLQNLFFSKLGKVYNPYDNSVKGKSIKMDFYKFLASKGYSGIVVDDIYATSFDFNTNEVINEVNKMVAEYTNSQQTLFNANLEPDTPAINKLEALGTYSAEEVSIIKEQYSEEEIEQMMKDDPREAKELFNELLFNNLWENSNFVTKDVINSFNKICK